MPPTLSPQQVEDLSEPITLIGQTAAPREYDFKLFGIDRDAPGDRLGLQVISKATGGDGKTRLRCIASSSVEDRHGDTMTDKCVRGMAKQAQGLTIFLNHQYRWPEDVFGFVESATSKSQDGVVLLMLTIVADESDERVARSIAKMEQGIRAGISIGAMLVDYEATEETKDSWWPSYIINEVELLEASVVGIPANPKSWVDQVVKTFRAKGILKPQPSTVGEAGPERVSVRAELGETVEVVSEEGAQAPEVAQEADPPVEPPPAQVADGPEEIVNHYLSQLEAGLWGLKNLEERLTGSVAHAIAWGIEHGQPEDFADVSVEDLVAQIMSQYAAPVEADKSSKAAAPAATPEAKANAEGDPENALEVLPEESNSGTADEGNADEAQKEADDQLNKLAEAGVLSSLSDLTDVLKDNLIALSTERAARETAEGERDQLAEQLRSANDTVEAAVKLIRTLMDTPVGRKTQIAAEIAKSDFASRLKASPYDEEVLQLMSKGDTP